MSKTLFHGPHTLKIANFPIPAATTNDKCCVACAMWVRDINSSGGAASIIYIPLSQLSQNSFSHSTRSIAAFPQRSHKTAN